MILTTAANRSMADVHSRMPVVLNDEVRERWLANAREASHILEEIPPLLVKKPA